MATKDQLETMMSEKELENEKLKAELKAMKEAKEREKEQAEQEANDPRRMVSIELFKDTGRYKDALFVNVNEYNALIPRGKRVSVPYYVYLHIKEMQAQDAQTANMIRMYEDEWKSNARKAGL